MNLAYLLEVVLHAIMLRPKTNPKRIPWSLPFSVKNANHIVYAF